MTSRGTWLPVAAAALTVALTGLVAHGSPTLAITVGLLLPVLVPALWVAVALTEPQHGRGLAAAAVAVALGLVAVGLSAGLVLAVYVLAGGAIGTLWRRHWRALAVVGAGALCLAPGFLLGLDGQSVPAVFADWGDELRAQHAAGLPEDLPAAERAAAVAAFDERLTATLDVQRRLWPALLAVGLMVQTLVALAMGRGLARVGRGEQPRPADASFGAWRAPFGTVWLLIAGLGASLAPIDRGWNDLGWNLVLVVAVLLTVQGLAVLAWLVRRVLPPQVRGLFWVLGVGFFAPVLVGSGLLVGLVDQWWDLRRLRRPPDQDVKQT